MSGTKIVIPFETIKFIMVHKRKFLILALLLEIFWLCFIGILSFCQVFPKLGGLRFRFRQNKKAWELTSHSSHSLRPSHCPALLNEQRQISCNIQNDKKLCVNANIYSI